MHDYLTLLIQIVIRRYGEGEPVRQCVVVSSPDSCSTQPYSTADLTNAAAQWEFSSAAVSCVM